MCLDFLAEITMYLCGFNLLGNNRSNKKEYERELDEIIVRDCNFTTKPVNEMKQRTLSPIKEECETEPLLDNKELITDKSDMWEIV